MEPMTPAPASRPLQIQPCQSICVWRATGEMLPDQGGDELRVFACVGCGSEWVRTEAWTPIDSGGAVPSAVAAERDRATSERGGAAAGSEDT